jgi:opacity protein-like surface antigen
MGGGRISVTALVCGFAMTTAAHAADPAGVWLPEIKKPIYTDLISGWYARGDLGYRKYHIDSVDAPTANTVLGFDIANTWTLGFGGGYQYKWFRTDVTLDYANKARFHGDTPQGPGYFNTQIDSFTLLANVYFDLGNWAGFTPYFGLGAGTTSMRTHDFRIADQLPSQGVADTTRWNFSWAAMAGVSYQITQTTLVDVGYRYLQLGEAISGTWTPNTPTPFINTARVTMRDMTAHELRIGLRWMLD